MDEYTTAPELFYFGAANIVHKHVKNEPNPYLAMLDKDIRSKIQIEFIRELKAVVDRQITERRRILDEKYPDLE